MQNIDDLLLSYMPEHIKRLATVDLPLLKPHLGEWKRFLWQRASELSHQLNKDYTEGQFSEAMSKTLDFFTDEEYSPAFIKALKASLYDIAVLHDEYTPAPTAPAVFSKARLLPDIEPAESREVPSILKARPPKKPSPEEVAPKSDAKTTPYAVQVLYDFGHVSIVSVFMSAAVAGVDIARNGYDHSLAKRIISVINTPSSP